MKLIFLKGVNMKDLKSKMEVLIFISENRWELVNITFLKEKKSKNIIFHNAFLSLILLIIWQVGMVKI